MVTEKNLYQEIAVTLTQLSEGKELESNTKKLTEQISSLKNVRAKTAALSHPSEDESFRLSQLPGQQEARKAYFDGQSALYNSEYQTPQILDILSGLSESVPVKGEGKP